MTRIKAIVEALAPFVWESPQKIEELILANFCPANGVLCDYPYYHATCPSHERCIACWGLEIGDKNDESN